MRNRTRRVIWTWYPNEGRELRVDRLLSNSFGFGGINSCLVLGRV